MATLRILAKNIIESATVTASPACVASLPESILLLPTERGRATRSTSTAAQTFEFEWASDQTVNMIGFTRFNLRTTGTLRSLFTGATSPDVVYDSGAVAAFSTSGLNTVIDDYTSDDFRELKNKGFYFTQGSARNLQVTAADATNPDGFLEITKIFAGQYFEPTFHPSGLEFTFKDASIQDEADDGTMVVDKRWSARMVTVNLDAILDPTESATMLSLSRYLGKYGECWLDPYPEDTTAKGIYARGAYRLIDSPAFGQQYGYNKAVLRFRGS